MLHFVMLLKSLGKSISNIYNKLCAKVKLKNICVNYCEVRPECRALVNFTYGILPLTISVENM